MSYDQIAARIKQDLDMELGFTFSVGLAPNKVIAKIASKWQKPSGLTVIPGHSIHTFLKDLPVGKVWGIGPNTAALLEKQGLYTALQFARKSEVWVKKLLTKPFYNIWQEFNGRYVLPLMTEEKATYHSIQKWQTFTPPSCDRAVVFAYLSKNIENACIKARKYHLAARGALVSLKTQQFVVQGIEVKFSRATAFPQEIMQAIEPAFTQLFHPEEEYRATGIVLLRLEEDQMVQLDLFGEVFRAEKLSRVYQAVDHLREQFVKHTVFLGSSALAHKMGQHAGIRGDAPERTQRLFKGETKRQRLGIPMFMGEVQ